MKKEKGFTLIELLAVIVLLAILMVIAVPKILNVIEKSRESAAESSIKLAKDAIRTQVTSGNLIGSDFTSDDDGCYTFNFDDQTSGNAKELKLKNKEQITGIIKYCNGTFVSLVCKRASTLHTEECTQTNGTYNCSGAGLTGKTITYGNLGSIGTLSSGDAFDCDVNGDGVYDENTERFYYVSDYYNTSTKSFENDTAVLIYYNNVSGGKPSNSTTYAYDSSGENFHGPITAKEQLPSTSEWKKVSLKSTTRAILNENGGNTTTGGTLPDNFSYEGKAARLLTAQEINKACNITVRSYATGELDSCNYLMENTKYSSASVGQYGYWLENPKSTDYGNNSMAVDGCARYVYGTTVTLYDQRGIRPVIEISKSDIEY